LGSLLAVGAAGVGNAEVELGTVARPAVVVVVVDCMAGGIELEVMLVDEVLGCGEVVDYMEEVAGMGEKDRLAEAAVYSR
jgi:hypothetical protein